MREERRVKNTTKKTFGIVVGSLICSSTALGSFGSWPSEPGYIYTSTSASDLNAAGFDNLTVNGNLEVVPAWCNGCWTSDSITTGGSLMAFIEIDVTYDPANADDGFYVIMNIDYTNPDFQFADFEAIIEESDTDVDVMLGSDAGTEWSAFSDWGIDPDSTVFQFQPAEFDGSLPGPYQTTTLTFGYNFSGYSGGFTNPFDGLVIGDIGAVPAPGAIALLGLSAFTSRRRRK
jgi:hypothetical protein